jgi:hypothetical protein
MSDKAGSATIRHQAGRHVFFHVAGHGIGETDSKDRRREHQQGGGRHKEPKHRTAYQVGVSAYLEQPHGSI